MGKNAIVDLSVDGLFLRKKKDKGGTGQTVFSVKVVLKDGHVNVIHQIYGQFVKLQDRLIEILKKDGRREQGKTLLPKLQGSRFLPKDEFKKLEKLKHFLKSLLTLPEEIIALDLICEFFMSADASSETSNEGPKRLDTDAKEHIEIQIVEEAIPAAKVESLYETCYNDTSWKPQDLHRLSDKTLDKLHQRLRNSLSSNYPNPVGFHGISMPSATGNAFLRRCSSHDHTLNRANGYLANRKNQELIVPLRKKYHSEMDLNANTEIYNGRRNIREVMAPPLRKPYRSGMQQNTITGLAVGGHDTHCTHSMNDTVRSNNNLHRRHRRQQPRLTQNLDSWSTASDMRMESNKYEQELPRHRRCNRRQLPSTPSRPSRLNQNVSPFSTAVKSERLYSSTSEFDLPLHGIARKRVDTYRDYALSRYRPPVCNSYSDEPVAADRRQDALPLSRFYSCPPDVRRECNNGSVTNLRSPSPLSFASSTSLDLTLYASSDTGSESEISSGGESVRRYFQQAQRGGIQHDTEALRRSMIWEGGSVKEAFDSYHSHGQNDGVLSYEVYIAMYCYSADGNGELSLFDGDEVMVIEKFDSGWWFVVKDDHQKGWAPSNFLRYAGCLQEPRSGPRSSRYLHWNPRHMEINEDRNSRVIQQYRGRGLTNAPEMLEYQRDQRDSATLTTEITMNRSIKFLTVEGIQKRKDPEKNYVYILKVVWSDGTINVIYRKCSDFFRLQEDLKQKFADSVGKQIPVLKGRKFYENCKFCSKDGSCKRMNFLNQFCHELINTQVRISRSDIVLQFCKPRNEDLNPQTGKKDKKNKGETAEESSGGEVISSPVVFEQHIAVADYVKQCKSDISLDAGDFVDVIEKNEYGWWLVDREGELGWAPASYLEPTDDGTEDTITTQKFRPGEEEVYMSIKEHKAKAGDELSFDIGVMLQVLQKTLDGWWLVRYQGREGWAPAMVLRKVDNNSQNTRKISAATGLRSDNDIDVSFRVEEKEADRKREFMARNPPERRSMVRRTINKKPKFRMELDGSIAENPVKQDLQEKSKATHSISRPASYHSGNESKEESYKPRSDSVPPNYSPIPSPRTKRKTLFPQAPPRTISKNFSLTEIDTFFRTHHASASSSGYDSSPGGSLTSLVTTGVLQEGGVSEDGERLRSYDSVSECAKGSPQNKLGMRRTHSSSELLMLYAMEQEMERQRERSATLERSMGPYTSNSLQRLGNRAKSSTSLNSLPRPIPAPRKISHTKSPLASQGSPENRSHSSKDVSPDKSASLERHRDPKELTSVFDYENDVSDSSRVILPAMMYTAPTKEAPQSPRAIEERSSLKDNSECYSPVDDTVFDGEPQQQEENKENQPENKMTDAKEAESLKYRATFCYDGEEEQGELRFSEGEILEVIRKNENGWWLLQTNGGIGWGPSTYLEALKV